MTLGKTVKRLAEAGVPDPEVDARQLISASLGINISSVMAGGDFSSPLLESYITRRCNREPLQYILGEWDFMGYTFKVSPECLIPRPDTELLCSHLVSVLPQGGRFADLCTGSGCIAVSALKMRPDATAAAIELYPETAAVAAENSASLGTESRLEIIVSDVTSEIDCGTFDVIVSNPPYVSADEMNELAPEVSMEPRAALTDGGDGLSIIRKIIEMYPSKLNEGGILALEIGWKQADAVCRIAEKEGLIPSVLHDIEGRDRVVSMRKAAD